MGRTDFPRVEWFVIPPLPHLPFVQDRKRNCHSRAEDLDLPHTGLLEPTDARCTPTNEQPNAAGAARNCNEQPT